MILNKVEDEESRDFHWKSKFEAHPIVPEVVSKEERDLWIKLFRLKSIFTQKESEWAGVILNELHSTNYYMEFASMNLVRWNILHAFHKNRRLFIKTNIVKISQFITNFVHAWC